MRMSAPGPLAIIETHPVQYRAPVYQALARDMGVPLTVIYGSDFSVAGSKDREFGVEVAWDTDLLSDTNATFLSRVSEGGAGSFETVSARGLGRAIERAGASAVLATGYRPMFNLAGIFAARRRGIPVLFRAETSDEFTRPPASGVKAWTGLARDTALRRIYSLCERVLPIGARSRSHYRRLGVPDYRMIFSPYCVNTAPFRCDERDRETLRGAMRRELGIPAQDIVVLFAGKLSERKGVHTLVSAVKRMAEPNRARTVILFVGTGGEADSLASACAAAPSVRAIFAGFRNQSELSPYYHAADVFTLPSLWGETWGLVVNEALHHGVPCAVSAAVGCASDLVEEGITGAVAEPGSAAELAEAIDRTMDLARNRETRARCRERVNLYSTAVAAAGIARAWSDVVGWNGTPATVSRGTAA